MYEISYTQNDLFGLISVIQFFPEPVDFLLIAADSVYMHTAQNRTGNTAAEQQTDQKVQHSFITSLSCGVSDFRNSPSVCSSPVKFGSVSSVKEIYPCFPKSSGSFVITEPPWFTPTFGSTEQKLPPSSL